MAYGLIGEIYISRGDEAEALKFFEKCPASDPYYANLHYYLGRKSLTKGDKSNAKKEFELALTHPNFWGGHWGLGHLAYLEKDYEKALDSYRTACNLSNEADAILGLADVLFILEQDVQAHFFYLRYISLMPESDASDRVRQNIKQLEEVAQEIETLEKVSFILRRDRNVKVVIYGENGDYVKNLFTGFLCNGDYVMGWDGTNDHDMPVDGDTFFGIVELGDSTIIQRIEASN